MFDWKKETCEFCIFRDEEICRKNPEFKKVLFYYPLPRYYPACSKIQLETTSDEKEGNFCQCEGLEKRTFLGVDSGIVGRCNYVKNHKIYHDSFVCWKCLLPRKS